MPNTPTCPDCLEAATPSPDGTCPFCGGRALEAAALPRSDRRRWATIAAFVVAALLLALVALRGCADS